METEAAGELRDLDTGEPGHRVPADGKLPGAEPGAATDIRAAAV